MAGVDLESKLLLNEGLAIQSKDGMGRVTVATKSFGSDKNGAAIIRETPTLVWPDGNFDQFLLAFQRADRSTQEGILDMYHPPLSASPVAALGTVASALMGRHGYDDAAFIHKLLAIVATNAHEYYGEQLAASGGDLRVHETYNSPGAPKSALFLFGSKIAHSCRPNLSYTSKTGDGALEYKVIRPIAEGDLACFSYLDDLFQTPTPKRREILSLTKSFHCECARCLGPDYCRSILCTDCGKRFLFCRYDSQGTPSWRCRECGLQEGIESKEAAFVRRWKTLEVHNAEQPLRPLQEFAENASKELSPSHYLTIEALDTITRLSASKAASQDMQQRFMAMMSVPSHNQYGMPTREFRKLAAETGLKAVAAGECVAAGCGGCYISSFQTDKKAFTLPHDSVYELGGKVFHACTDLMSIPRKARPFYSQMIVKRYLPSLRGLFGNNDLDVQAIENELIQDTPPLSASMGRTSSLAPARKGNQKPRRSNKKKRRR